MRLSPEQEEKEIKIISIKNPLQKELIKESEWRDKPIEWINRYGSRLDELLHDPEIEELFNEARHDELKQKIKERLYH